MKKIETMVLALPLRDEHKERIRKLLPETELIFNEFLKAEEADVHRADVILGNVKQAYIQGAEKLKWVQLCSAGTDGYIPVLPKDALLTNASGVYGSAIGEFMLAMLMSVQKNLQYYGKNQVEHNWAKAADVKTFENSTCLVLGLGDLGGNFAKRVKALGSYVIGVRRTKADKPVYVDELYQPDALRELLPRADIVAMTLPQTPDTAKIMNEETISLMKPGSILVNVGRGSAVDQDALIKALESGHLAGAAIDVMEPEPLPADHPLWDAKNLLITPHISGQWTLPSIMDNVVDIFERNVKAYLNGDELENMVDYETGYRKTV